MFQAERIIGAAFKRNRLIEFLRPPFRRFEILTPISPAHAARILEEIVEPPRKWGWPTSSKRGYFEGRVAGSRFKIHRIINYQNAFVPIIEGNFRRDERGTLVTLNMRLVWPVVPVWLGIMLAVNLQTSYMHPPLGPTLYYLRGVAPPEVTTRDIYLGIIPFVLIQLAMLVALWFAPGLATWLPHRLYAS